ncbi:MAG: hypothetical protein RL375_4829 [Pseudomonadota bacterium]|jgi:hypothetical protein
MNGRLPRLTWRGAGSALLPALVIVAAAVWVLMALDGWIADLGASGASGWPGGVQVFVNGRPLDVTQLGEVWAGLATGTQWLITLIAVAVVLLVVSIALLIVPVLVLGLMVLVILFALGGASVPLLLLIGALAMLLLVLSPVLLALWMMARLVGLLVLRPLRWLWRLLRVAPDRGPDAAAPKSP